MESRDPLVAHEVKHVCICMKGACFLISPAFGVYAVFLLSPSLHPKIFGEMMKKAVNFASVKAQHCKLISSSINLMASWICCFKRKERGGKKQGTKGEVSCPDTTVEGVD